MRLSSEIRRGAGAAAATVSGILEREAVAFDAAVEGSVKANARELQQDMRRQARANGLGRLAGSWRLRTYESGRQTAGFVYSRAKTIMQLAETGGTLRAKRGKYLAIPTKAAGRTAAAGGGRRRKRPEDFRGKRGIRIVPPAGRRPGLIIRETRTRSTVLFLLVRQTKHRKRLDFAGASVRAADRVATGVVERMPA